VINLMDALQKSLAAARDRGEARHQPEPRHKAAARTARSRKKK